MSCDLVKIVFLIFWPLGVTSLKICPTILREPYPFLYRNWIWVYLDNHTNTYKYSRIRGWASPAPPISLPFHPGKWQNKWQDVASLRPPISSNKTIYVLDGSIYRKLRCVIFLKMVSKNYSNILREFSEKLTEKLENSLTSKHIK